MAKRIINLDLVIGTIIVLIFMGLTYKKVPFLETVERYAYDAQTRFSQEQKRDSSEIVLIDIDDKSFSKLGSWPWPRDLIAEMIDNLTQSGAKLIGLNIPFIEKEPNKAVSELRSFKEKLKAYPFGSEDPLLAAWILENFKQMEHNLDNDNRLVESAQQSGNVILPAYGQIGTDGDKSDDIKNSALSNNFLAAFEISASLLKKLSTNPLSLPFPELAQTVSGVGYGNLSVENSMAGRSHLMFINHKGFLFPSTTA